MNSLESRFFDAFSDYANQKPVFSVYHSFVDREAGGYSKTTKIADCGIELFDGGSDEELCFSMECTFPEIQQKNIRNVFIIASLKPQYHTPSYTIDFMLSVDETIGEILRNDLGIEVDGHEWHEKNKEQAAVDKKRERDLLLNNIHIIRYTGSEVFTNAEKCVEEALKVFVSMCYYKIKEHAPFYSFTYQRQMDEFKKFGEDKNV